MTQARKGSTNASPARRQCGRENSCGRSNHSIVPGNVSAMSNALITYPRIDPIAIQVGRIAIRWYGLAYLTAFLTGYFWLHRMVRSGRLKISAEHLSELVAWLSVGVVLGGRAGWWVFYHRPTSRPE